MTTVENPYRYVCADCRAAIEVEGACPWCHLDNQAAPGQPIPKEMEPEDPPPADEVK